MQEGAMNPATGAAGRWHIGSFLTLSAPGDPGATNLRYSQSNKEEAACACFSCGLVCRGGCCAKTFARDWLANQPTMPFAPSEG